MDSVAATLLRLNLDTRAFHQAADEQILALLRATITQDEYAAWLCAMYGFQAPLERALMRVAGLDQFVDLSRRLRAGLAAKDLVGLGLELRTVNAVPVCALTPFIDAAGALGWMYVTERATLLHDRVRRHLLARFADANDVTAFLGAYDGVTSARWTELGHALERAVRAGMRSDEIVGAAQTGFRTLIAWMADERAYARGA